jgi:PUA domain protein
MRRREAKKIRDEAKKFLLAEKYDKIDEAKIGEEITVYVFGDKILLARKNSLLFPTLLNPILDDFPSIVVDMGAVPFICNGADIMAPGIVNTKHVFHENEVVAVKDARHLKSIAVGVSLFDSAKVGSISQGKAVLNLHHIGDKIWDSIK